MEKHEMKNTENAALTLPRLSDADGYKQEELLMPFDADWADNPAPISGGWGYTKDDAVVLEEELHKGVRFEHLFFKMRTRLETAKKYESAPFTVRFETLKSTLHLIDGCKYDCLEAEVNITTLDTEKRLETYHVEAWFNVDKLFEEYHKKWYPNG